MDQSELQAIVKANVDGCKVVGVPKQGTPLTLCPTNWNVQDAMERAMVFNGCSPGYYECTPDKPLRIVAHHYLVVPDGNVDEETGEVTEFARVVLYDRDGKTFRTSGVAAPSQIRRLCELFGAQGWEKGIPLLIVCRPSKRHRGSSYHDIQIDVDGMQEECKRE